MHVLTKKIEFPDVSISTKDGLLAIGGDLSVKRLVLAYKSGIFPWFEIDQPILWWSPDPRFVLFPNKLKIFLKSFRSSLLTISCAVILFFPIVIFNKPSCR